MYPGQRTFDIGNYTKGIQNNNNIPMHDLRIPISNEKKKPFYNYVNSTGL